MTNKKTLIDRLLDKWPAKVICLIIATLLYIFHQSSLIEKKTYTIPLHIIEDGIVMHVGNAPGAVSVVVKTTQNDIKTIITSDMYAYVSLDEITEKGTYKLPVSISINERLMENDPFEINLKTQTVTIDVDKKASRYIALTPSCIGEVAHGYTVADVSINPSSVLVSGPETVLNAIDEIFTTKINVSNAEKTFSTETNYIDVSKLLKVEDKGPYKATVLVKPVDFEQVYSNLKIEVVNIAENLIIDTELPTVTVKLAGTMPALEGYSVPGRFVQINLIDITEPGTYDIPIKYNVPSSFDLVEKSMDFVSISIIEKAVEDEAAEAEQNATENQTASEEG